MQFQSTIDHGLWTRAAVGLVPDVLIGAVIACITSSGLLGVIGTILGLQVLNLAVWIKNTGWNWIVFRVSGDHEKLRLAMFDYLSENRFPKPDEFFRNVSIYFQCIANDADLPCEQRIKAAAELAASQSMPKFGGQLRLLAAWGDAIEKYRLTFPAANHTTQNEIRNEGIDGFAELARR